MLIDAQTRSGSSGLAAGTADLRHAVTPPCARNRSTRLSTDPNRHRPTGAPSGKSFSSGAHREGLVPKVVKPCYELPRVGYSGDAQATAPGAALAAQCTASSIRAVATPAPWWSGTAHRFDGSTAGCTVTARATSGSVVTADQHGVARDRASSRSSRATSTARSGSARVAGEALRREVGGDERGDVRPRGRRRAEPAERSRRRRPPTPRRPRRSPYRSLPTSSGSAPPVPLGQVRHRCGLISTNEALDSEIDHRIVPSSPRQNDRTSGKSAMAATGRRSVRSGDRRARRGLPGGIRLSGRDPRDRSRTGSASWACPFRHRQPMRLHKLAAWQACTKPKSGPT